MLTGILHSFASSALALYIATAIASAYYTYPQRLARLCWLLK